MTKRVRTTRRLEVWLKDTSVALFVLNAHRRLVFFNVGCEQLTGWTPGDVLGQVCDFVTETEIHLPGAVLASLAAPSDVWRGQPTTVPVFLPRRELTPVSCVIHYYPLTDAGHKVQAALGIIQIETSHVKPVTVSQSQRLHRELAELRASIRQMFTEESLIGRSPAIRRVVGQLKLAQQSSVTVHFSGETGSGREHLARWVHYNSSTGQRPFVPLDCRKLPIDQLQSTFERLITAANEEAFRPGAVYLNHVDVLSRDLQRLVLELIESKDPLRPRIMTASHTRLQSFVESEQLLEELYFSLTSLEVEVPPLRHRSDDLELLAQYFLEELNRGDPIQINGFEDDVWQQFRRYNWPGNIGELRAVVIEARKNCTGTIIESAHLPFRFRTGVDRQAVGPAPRRSVVPLDPLLLQVEREQIELALAEAHQNRAKAAELLGITRPRLYRRMELLGLTEGHSDDDAES
ncbi:sigma-54-dependent Fis family transcriptional regulator [Schlesneria paludicola]|uniref:sigma-54-dependent Fis family transcriptional regulator n=1 Tax=Schlesneria paludicola TaxID=360056 RepID=UPI00029B44FE|nr:sigma-54-dependent Fis family transcriptional regulator [Schlesneria paludicola]